MDGRAHLRVKPARFLRIAAVVGLVASAALASHWRLVPVQTDVPTKHLAAGKILVARHSLEDPNFAETVIVLVQYDEDGTLGLIVNRQTKLPVSRLARDLEGAKGRTEPLYLGGPVAVSGVMGLVRTAAKLEDAKRVFGDVYMISSKTRCRKGHGFQHRSENVSSLLGLCRLGRWAVGV